jgi:YVTN family beta-propeller protein
MTGAILAGHRRIPPYGMAGGEPGDVGRNWVERADGSRTHLGYADETEVNANEVFVIDTSSFAIVARIKAGLRANGIAVHPDGKQVYVSNGGDGSVSVIDTDSNQVVATIPVGQRPWNMALTPDGNKLYVANGRSNSVSVIDTASRTKLRDIPVGKLPWGVVIR